MSKNLNKGHFGKHNGRKLNFVGLKRGFITGVREINEQDNSWEFICSCGNKVILRPPALYYQKTCGKSCQDLQNRRGASHRKPQSRTINEAYMSHKSNQSTRSKGFLPREEWESLVFQPCHYCGDIDIRNYGKYTAFQRKAKNFLTPEIIAEYNVKMNGVDRVDSSKPYTMDNCVPCCSHCNVIKMDYSIEEFLSHVKKIYEKNFR